MSAERHAIYEAGITPGIGYISGPDGEIARRKALEEDEDVSYRVIINIVGKERQGKTSLRRLLTYEQFDIYEESTVGIEHEMVDTRGVTESWASVSVKEANLNEYALVVGQCVRQRLRAKKECRGSKYYLTHVVLFFKLTMVCYFFLGVYFSLLHTDAIVGIPWMAGLLIAMFTLSALTFEVKDGLGIAMGIVALILHNHTLLSLQPSLAVHFKAVKEATFSFVPYLESYFLFGAIDSIVALPLGASLGKGMPFVLCMSVYPPERETNHFDFYNPHIHLFTFFTVAGISSYNFQRFKYFVLLPLSCTLMAVLPEEYSYTLCAGLGCGQCHVLVLRVGQNCYLAFNKRLKRYFPQRWERRLLVDLVSIIPGVFSLTIFGWDIRYITSPSHFCSALMFVVSIHFINKILGKPTEGDPRDKVDKPSDILLTRIQTPCVKLIINDFAGHPLYHCTHQIYMSGQALYMVVFNLVEAKHDYLSVLSQLLSWIQSIYTHADSSSATILLVATHRDNPQLAPEDRHVIGKRLRGDIPKSFQSMLVWNKCDVPFFAVENSLRDEKDADHKALRNTLIYIAKNSPFRKETWPVRYLAFFQIIESFRSQGDIIQDISVILEKTKSSECGVQTLSELEDLLLYFNSIGEVMYNIRDNRLKDIVIFDPKVIVNIMGVLVTIPPKHQRDREVFQDWTTLEESGVCSEKLFKHVLMKVSLNIYTTIGCEKIALLLEKYDLLCRVSLPLNVQRSTADDYYLIPACLNINPLLGDSVWDTIDSDVVFYADFGLQNVSPIYLRLICQCTGTHNVSVTTDGITWFNMDQKCALFNLEGTHSYKIEICRGISEKSVCRELIKITIRSWTDVGCTGLIKQLNARLGNIVRSNFDKCRYILGVACPCEGPHEPSEGKDPAILPVVGTDSMDPQLLLRKDFVCRGRKVVVESGQIRVEAPGYRPIRYGSLDLSRKILDLPETVYRHICSSLNNEQVLAKDWKGLAGALQYSHRQVELLTQHADPCNALLKHWSTFESTSATLGNLIFKLEEIQRQDLVTYLQNPNEQL